MVGREIGSFEFQILATLMAKRSDAYGLTIRDRIKETFEREVSVGAIYTSLNRLEDKGFVSSKWGESTEERGGRRKRLYEITANGEQAARRFSVGLQQTGFRPAWG